MGCSAYNKHVAVHMCPVKRHCKHLSTAHISLPLYIVTPAELPVVHTSGLALLSCCCLHATGSGVTELLSYLGVEPGAASFTQLVAQNGPLLPAPDGGTVAVLGQQQVLAPLPATHSAVHGVGPCSPGVSWGVTPAHTQQLPQSNLQPRYSTAGLSCSSPFLTSWLLQVTQPDGQRLLGAEEFYPLLSQLQQLIVVSSSWLPDGVIHVLLRGGAAAVVSAADAAAVEELDAVEVAEFFRGFYEGLMQAGLDVLEALHSAAAAVPAVSPGVFECYQL